MQTVNRDLRWTVPISLLLGLALALAGPGSWWSGWLAYALILFLGMTALTALWRSGGSIKTVGWMLILTVVLRLGLGITFSYMLPAYGNDTPVQKAGYIFSDAYQRDTQAWDLASSKDSLFQAFDKTVSITDQYGGLLFLSSLVYRFVSPEAHRPWLIILVGALMAGIGVALAFKASQKAWGERVAIPTSWIMVLFPEAILLGSSQMREPFLIAFIAMAFWGVIHWEKNRLHSAAWIAGGLLGLVLFNSGVAVAAIVTGAVWYWFSRRERQIKWWVWAGAGGMALAAGVLFILALPGGSAVKGGLFGSLLNWFRLSANWDAKVQELNSGWLQNIFAILPSILHTPFIIAYGILQPVLPAAIADPGVWPMRILGILRGLGWYALLPFLVYSLRSILKMADRRARWAWLWLWIVSWIWLLLSSFRAGGDQWDNPRYRTILLIFEAALAAQAFVWQRSSHDRWLGRFLSIEGVFLLFFGYWYFARYTNWSAGQVHIFVIMALILFFTGVIVVAGWLTDRQASAVIKRP